ncbi:MAG: bifunctional riboflavin kinase/FAD synthetase [Chitinophagales bacterium]|nr:bifunctional riboflavin kinase/FAD synthetase [Chitinophagales bacterium]MDW8392668.1 bifunctional riboflavin kinase/FAD synthetase [Chitinophagales bacterium]
MIVHHQPEQLAELHGCVLTTGTFDGVHLGHRKLIECLVDAARQRQVPSVLITFHPHPRKVIRPDQPPLPLLTTTEEKLELLQPLGIDHVVIVPFTEAFSRMSATEYVQQFLVQGFRPRAIVIGYNHHFGRHRDGNSDLLRKLAAGFHYEVIEVGRQQADDVEASSTRIRLALQEGDVQQATRLLTYPYFLSGTVVAGDRIGRQLGFPTANLEPASPDKLIPGDGVYAVHACINQSSRRYPGLTAIGKRPTVNGRTRTIETYLLDFDGQLYGCNLRIEFLHFLRPERTFPNVDELVAAMKADEQAARMLPDLFTSLT